MIGGFEQAVIGLTLIAIMLGMGASLRPQDFRQSLRTPKGLLIGVACQFGIMPAVGFLIAASLNLSPNIVLGLMILSCMPGGTTSNMFTYFSRGNLALSLSMTVTSTIIGVMVIPVLLSIYSSALNVSVPIDNVVQTLVVILVPVAIGMTIRWFSAKIARYVEIAGASLACLFIPFLIITWIPRNLEFLQSTSIHTYLAAIGLGVVGMALGYIAARLLQLRTAEARAVSLETGIQNAPLAMAIVLLSYTGTVQQEAIAIPALYGIFIVCVSTLATFLFRMQRQPSGAMEVPSSA